MTRREARVIKAFLNCIRHGEYTVDYAITLIEDNQRYRWRCPYHCKLNVELLVPDIRNRDL